MSRFIFGGVLHRTHDELPDARSHVVLPVPLVDARPDLFVDADHHPVIVDWRADEDARAFPLALATVLEHCARADQQCVLDAAGVVARHLDLEPLRGARA